MVRPRPWAGVLLFAGAAVFWLVNTAAEASYPAYDIHDDALSRLGSLGAPTAWYWNGALLLLGSSWLLGIILALRGRVGRTWLALNAIPPLFVFLVGLFPVGSIAALHNLGAYGGFTAGGVVMLADARILRGPIRYASALLGAFTLGCLAVFTFLSIPDVVGYGGGERLVAYPILIWLMCAGGYLMAGGGLAGRGR
jgi:hypothetical membrane protein